MPIIMLAIKNESGAVESLGTVKVERGEVALTKTQLDAVLNLPMWWIVRVSDQAAARLLQCPVVEDASLLEGAIPLYSGENQELPWQSTSMTTEPPT